MNSGRSSEIVVLLMACTVELTPEVKSQLIQFLDQHPLTWDRLYTLANRHRVIPFLYRVLQQLPSIPGTFLAKLQNDCRTNATDNLIKLHEYDRLRKLFAEHNIRHIAIKGVYLAENSYPDSSLRSIGDFDILVERKDVFKAIQILEANQYRLGEEYKHYLLYAERVILTDLHEVSLFKSFFTSYFNIDLHWEIECFNKHYGSIYLEEILSEPAFLIENQLVVLVVHHGLVNIWQYIGYLNDLYFLLKDKEVDWPYLMQKLTHYGLETVFLVGLYWCQQVWALSLPLSIEELAKTDRVRSLAEAYEKNWEAPTSVLIKNPGLKQIVFFTNSQTQLSKKVKIYRTYISSFVFRAGTFKVGRRLLYVPKELGFINVAVRAIRSLSNFLPSQREGNT